MFEGIGWLFRSDNNDSGNNSGSANGSLFATDNGKGYTSFSDIFADARDKYHRDGGSLNLSYDRDSIKPHMDPW